MVFSVLMIFASCIYEKKNDVKSDIVQFEKFELFGRWIQTSKIEDLKKIKGGIISKINFKDNFTAEVEIQDSIGYKTIFGNWKVNREQKIGSENFNVSFNSDIILTFDRSRNYKEILVLKVEELNKKKVLTSYKIKFEKE